MDQLFEAEVILITEIVEDVGEGNLIPVEDERLRGHQLHQLLAEVPHEPLLEERDDHASFRTQVKGLLVLGLRGCV